MSCSLYVKKVRYTRHGSSVTVDIFRLFYTTSKATTLVTLKLRDETVKYRDMEVVQ